VAPALASFLEVPSRQVLVACDFDGTLAPIVADPAHAAPLPGLIRRLSEMAPLARGVAVLSGRTDADLRRLLPIDGVLLIGENGSGAATPDERLRLRAFEQRARPAVAGWPGVVIEVKPASVSVHFRARPEIASELQRVVRELIGGSRLSMVANRLVFDVRPARAGKVQAIRRLILELNPAAVFYAGDGRDDARVIRCLKAAGLAAFCAGLASDEIPAPLLRHADVVLDSPQQLDALLGQIVARWRGSRGPVDL
jgi:trehalose 6-phosphate phosphatase